MEVVSLKKVLDEAISRGLLLDSVNVSDIEVCCECNEVLFVDDEAYEDKNGKTLCTKCSFLCESCDKYVKKSELDPKKNMCSECKSILKEWGGSKEKFDN